MKFEMPELPPIPKGAHPLAYNPAPHASVPLAPHTTDFSNWPTYLTEDQARRYAQDYATKVLSAYIDHLVKEQNVPA